MALQTASDITEKVFDLRVILAKMSERQKELFLFMVKGYSELETLLLAKRIGEVAGVVPVVRTEDGQIIKTVSLKKLADLKRLEPESLAALDKLAKDHIHQSVGDFDYQRSLTDIAWFFKMMAPSAAQTIVEIMEDVKVSPQTRLSAANSLLGRAGYAKETHQVDLPVRVVINMPAYQLPSVIEGEEVRTDPLSSVGS